ncbi:MAG: acetyl-CoA carboxylase carboxyltransferase subunit alpha [Clostridia bacterium]|nr:acetyl-CoA carboxylase carboxyltransferase subunit alpha [Clostridia bacterium]
MANTVLDFERPLLELEEKIAELRKFTDEKGIDFSEEIKTLEKRARELKKDIYGNLTPWQRVLIARHAERPTAEDYIKALIADFIELHGDRSFGDDKAIIGGIGRFQGRPVTVIGHLKGKETKQNIKRNFGMPHPEGYRKALRLMKQAEKFKRPVLCFIDTPGAYCGVGAEERGQGEAIARNLMEMSTLKTPVIAVVIGEGGSGGALALGMGDRVFMLENSVYSISSPEAFATILWKDATRAGEATEKMKMTARDLQEMGIIDEIIPEPLGGAHRDYETTARNIATAIQPHLEELIGLRFEELLANRYQKFRSIGVYQEG